MVKKFIAELFKGKQQNKPSENKQKDIKPIKEIIKEEKIDNKEEKSFNVCVEKKKYGKIVSLEEYKKENVKLCKACNNKIHKDDCKVSATHKEGYYYIVCTCGFVNKIVKGKVIIPKISEVKISKELLSLNGYEFNKFTKRKGGEPINIE